MTEAEALLCTKLYRHWLSAGDISALNSRVFIAQRATTVQGQVMMHGISLMADALDQMVYGDPLNQGFNPQGREPLPLFQVATVNGVSPALLAPEVATLQTQVADLQGQLAAGSSCYGQVLFAPGSPLGVVLAANAFATLTGGALTTPLRNVAYNAGTGELTVNLQGDYWVSGTLISERTLGLASNVQAAVFVNGAQSGLLLQDNSGLALGERETNSASQLLRLVAGDKLTLRIRSTLAITLGVAQFALGLHKIGQ